MTQLIRYEAACRALAEAKAVDEVLEIRNAAEAMRAYARQAKNKQPEIDAAELRIRAERCLGEMLIAQKKTIGMNKGGRPKKPSSEKEQVLTLDDVGIDRKLSMRAQKYAAVPDDEWEEELEGWRERVSAENNRVTTRLQNRGESEIRRSESKDCDIPDSALVSGKFVCPKCGQDWPEGKPIHG